MKKRVFSTIKHWLINKNELPKTFDRLTVFATHKCNFKCKYCNGPHMDNSPLSDVKIKDMLSADLSLSDFTYMVESILSKGSEIDHIHFTGGEPTLNKNLEDMVSLASSHNILTSITTNGSSSPELYIRLAEKGMTEFRISIDSDNKDDFNEMVGLDDGFQKTIKTIETLSKYRIEHKENIFLCFNVCIGASNLSKLNSIVKFLLQYEPNDIKLLVIAEERESVSNREWEKYRNKLGSILDEYPEDRFPLLRIKISQLFDQFAIGLKDDKSQEVMDHCYIPINERTFDGKYYYPCSIYTRLGEPIGPITDSIEEQQRKIVDFIETNDCREDEVCYDNCVNCTRVLNVRVSEELRLFEKEIRGENAPDIFVEELESVLRGFQYEQDQDYKSFLLIKPYGMDNKAKIYDIIKSMGFEIDEIKYIDVWDEKIGALVYCNNDINKLRKKSDFSYSVKAIENGSGELVIFKDNLSIEQLDRLKSNIRNELKTKLYLVKTDTRYSLFHLNAVHTPSSTEESHFQVNIILHLLKIHY